MYGLVSIHAPAWGATLPICPKGDGSGCFNPRTRVGCDQLSLISGVSDDGVSIHAPAWGATRTARCNRATVMWFQSTHPRGVRPAGHKDCHRSRDGRRKRFNPRTRVGCDPCLYGNIHHGGMFQSTHPRGVRRRAFTRCGLVARKFQSTHPRGVRRMSLIVSSGMTGFQSTHPRGVRLFPCFIQ